VGCCCVFVCVCTHTHTHTHTHTNTHTHTHKNVVRHLGGAPLKFFKLLHAVCGVAAATCDCCICAQLSNPSAPHLQHASAYVSIRQHTSAYVRLQRLHATVLLHLRPTLQSFCASPSAYVSIPHHTYRHLDGSPHDPS
jgi:hypothetical protein